MVCRTPLLQLFQQLVYAAGMVLQGGEQTFQLGALLLSQGSKSPAASGLGTLTAGRAFPTEILHYLFPLRQHLINHLLIVSTQFLRFHGREPVLVGHVSP